MSKRRKLTKLQKEQRYGIFYVRQKVDIYGIILEEGSKREIRMTDIYRKYNLGKDFISRRMRELIEKEYLIQTKILEKGKRRGTYYTITEEGLKFLKNRSLKEEINYTTQDVSDIEDAMESDLDALP